MLLKNLVCFVDLEENNIPNISYQVHYEGYAINDLVSDEFCITLFHTGGFLLL